MSRLGTCPENKRSVHIFNIHETWPGKIHRFKNLVQNQTFRKVWSQLPNVSYTKFSDSAIRTRAELLPRPCGTTRSTSPSASQSAAWPVVAGRCRPSKVQPITTFRHIMYPYTYNPSRSMTSWPSNFDDQDLLLLDGDILLLGPDGWCSVFNQLRSVVFRLVSVRILMALSCIMKSFLVINDISMTALHAGKFPQ
jgi:hypothetical protein